MKTWSTTSSLPAPGRSACSDAKDRLGLAALLVRPDGFVAWATDTPPADLDDVLRTAARWFARREAVTG